MPREPKLLLVSTPLPGTVLRPKCDGQKTSLWTVDNQRDSRNMPVMKECGFN